MIPTTTKNSPKPQPFTLRVYLRQSLSEDKQSDSIEAQRGVIAHYAREQGLPWHERMEYKDIDRAGDDFTREDLVRLITETQPGDLILTRDDSRIGRDALDTAVTLRELVGRRGARLYYVAKRQEVQFKTALDAGMAVLQGMGAAMELENIRSRTRDALRERARRGYAVGLVPFGYRIVPVDESNPDGFKRVEFDPNTVQVVRNIFEQFASGLGVLAVASKLIREGAPGPRTGWSPAQVWAMLRNPTYTGVFRYGVTTTKRVGGRVFTIKAPPEDIVETVRPDLAIIDEALWVRVQSEIAARRKDMKGNCNAVKHPLSGILRCGSCGRAMRTRTSDGGHWGRPDWKRTYYICGEHNRTRRCELRRSIPADIAEKAMVDFLLTEVLPRAENEVITAIRLELARATQARDGDTTRIEAELKNVRDAQKRLVRVLSQTDTTVPELLAEMKENAVRIKRLERNLEVAKAPALDAVLARQLEADARDYIAQLRTKLATERRDVLREVLKALFPKGLRYRSEGKGGAWIIDGVALVNSIKKASFFLGPAGATALVEARRTTLLPGNHAASTEARSRGHDGTPAWPWRSGSTGNGFPPSG